MDLVYAHGQVSGQLADQPSFGIVAGSTTNPGFYAEDAGLRYFVDYHNLCDKPPPRLGPPLKASDILS